MKKVCKALSLLWVALLVVLMLFPVCYMVVHSLKNIDLIETFYQGVEVIKARLLIEPFYISFEQYYEILFRTPQFLYMFWNAMIIVVPIAILQVVIAVFAAYGFSKLKFWGSDILFFIYIVIMLMPFQVTVVPNYIILECFNLLDKYAAIILPGVWGTFSVFFLKQFMDGIQKEFLEEARILGANEFQILHYIIVPMCKSVITSVVILVFFDYWSMVEQPITFLSSAEKYPLSVYLATLADSNIGIGFACSVLYMILPILLAIYAQSDLTDSMQFTSLK